MGETKLSKVRAAMAAGDWRAATLQAAKFGELGDQRNAILSAREAYLRPAFQAALGKSTEKLKSAGRAALAERFGDV